MLEQEVKSLAHDWKVLTKKRVHNTNYYLLKDVLKTPISLFKIVAESKEVSEQFSGRIVEIEDIAEKFEIEKDKQVKTDTGYKTMTETKKVPYIHKLWDFGMPPVDTALDIFSNHFAEDGLELVKVRLQAGERSELLFTTQKIEVKEEKHSNRKKKSESMIV